MLAALAGDLVLLPNLLLIFDRVPRRKPADTASGTAPENVVGEHHLRTAGAVACLGLSEAKPQENR